MRFIGNNTIEIYFIHYFLLFTLPTIVGSYLTSLIGGRVSFIELLIVGFVDVIICIGSVVSARMIKSLPYLSQLFFGR
jgi:hypothetical protein